MDYSEKDLSSKELSQWKHSKTLHKPQTVHSNSTHNSPVAYKPHKAARNKTRRSFDKCCSNGDYDSAVIYKYHTVESIYCSCCKSRKLSMYAAIT